MRPSAVDILLKDRETWETHDNYDGSRKEATRFNATVPTVLLNGDSGIAVGYATKLAPHSLRSIVAATKLLCELHTTDTKRASNLEKARQVLIPDFPTGCEIVNDDQLVAYTQTGSGGIRCRARYEVGTQKRDGRAKDRATVTFTNLPPNVNPEKLGEQIKNELEKGRIEGIAEILDESDLSGDRLTVVAKPGVDAEPLAKLLFAHTDLDTRYSAKTLVIDNLKPVELSPVEICQRWFAWRLKCLEKQLLHEQDLKMQRLEVVMGFLKAIDKIDAVIKVIRASKTTKEALVELVSNRTLKFTADQARAILEMKLRQLTNLDTDELVAENSELDERLAKIAALLGSHDRRVVFLLKQMDDLAKRHGEATRSPLVPPPAAPSGPSPRAAHSRPTAAPKPRFLRYNFDKSAVEQVKVLRGSLVLESTDKLVCVAKDGFVAKVGPKHSGPIFDRYTPSVLAKKELDLADKKYLCVFSLDTQLKAFVLSGTDLCKTTSKGKRYLPEGAQLVYFGDGAYDVPWQSTRKKKLKLTTTSVKAGKPGGKGVKVADLGEVTAPVG